MGLLDTLKEILCISPVNIGELNRQATHSRFSPPSVAPPSLQLPWKKLKSQMNTATSCNYLKVDSQLYLSAVRPAQVNQP
jgi:hypothetical protein